MTKEELLKKYPAFKVVSEPVPNCPCCKGAGEFTNGKGDEHVCLCVCLGGNDSSVRGKAVELFQTFISERLAELRRKHRG